MRLPRSDAFVFFGATGDLAYKQIFPALQALVRAGALRCPHHRRGARRLERSTSSRRAPRRAWRTTAACEQDAFAQAARRAALRRRRLHRPDHLRRAAAPRWSRSSGPLHYLAIPPSMFAPVVEGLADTGCAEGAPGGGGEAVRPRPRLGAGAQPDPARGTSPRSVHLPHRPLPGQGAGAEHPLHPLRQLRSSSRSGTGPTSPACRSPWRRTSACEGRGRSTRRPAPSATCCRTTCCRSWPASRWTPPTGDDPEAIARREGRACSRRSRPLDPGARGARPVQGYRAEPGVAPDSSVETFVALRLVHRQLALGRRALLHPRRQVPAGHLRPR